MTVRFVSCDVCQRIGDFQAMQMCPVCRKTVCRRCKHDGLPRAGYCLKSPPCDGHQNPPAGE